MYTFNTNLRVGDIILIRGAAKYSKLIAKVTNGHFSHAMIALENDIFLEAITGSGVQTTSMLRVSFKDKTNVVVLRCNFPNEKTRLSSLEYITRNFSIYQGRKYSYKGAVESIISSRADHTNGGYFCSHLVAAIYTDSGFPLINKPVYKVTPNELLTSEFVEDITEQVISPYSDIALQRIQNKGEKLNCIDAGGSTASQDAKNHNKLLKVTAKYFTRYGLKAPQRCGDFPEILTNGSNSHFAKKLDYQIIKKYKEIGINQYVLGEKFEADFELDWATIQSEMDQYGYDYANDLYGSYNYMLITSIVKLLNARRQLSYFESFYNEWKFKYFLLKVEYHTSIIKHLSEIMDYYLDILNNVEAALPNYFDDFQETKKLIVTHVISKQVDPEQKTELIKFIKDLL
ncbi:hypothetical protein [Photobacterium phosphoreum]|uniref:hypothetical protein n=1 Tax=Photobacterium phosphoreum TaxID=659 RepID=UPI0024325052|nr:hypothetical protein [Photobacterium phosphoreum]